MRNRIFALALLGITLTGCASVQKLEAVYQTVTETTVSPQQIYLAANTFDAIQATATQYFNYCRKNLTVELCSADNRRIVIRGVRAGRAARNQLESYLSQDKSAPAAIYNTMIAVITSLQQSAITKVGAAQ